MRDWRKGYGAQLRALQKGRSGHITPLLKNFQWLPSPTHLRLNTLFELSSHLSSGLEPSSQSYRPLQIHSLFPQQTQGSYYLMCFPCLCSHCSLTSEFPFIFAEWQDHCCKYLFLPGVFLRARRLLERVRALDADELELK